MGGPSVLMSIVHSHQTSRSTSSFTNLNMSFTLLYQAGNSKYLMCQVILWVLPKDFVWYMAPISFITMVLHFVGHFTPFSDDSDRSCLWYAGLHSELTLPITRQDFIVFSCKWILHYCVIISIMQWQEQDSLILANGTDQKELTGVPDNHVAFTDLPCHIHRLKKKYILIPVP
jgi:hypothetical protein